MKIECLRDLDKLLVLCRKRGVQSIRVDGVEFHLGPVPVNVSVKRRKAAQVKNDIENDISMSNEMTPEQLLFGSSDPSVWADAKTTIAKLEKTRLES